MRSLLLTMMIKPITYEISEFGGGCLAEGIPLVYQIRSSAPIGSTLYELDDTVI